MSKFIDHFVVVSKGELSLPFDPKVIKKHKRETDAEDDIGDGNWLRNAVKLGTYNLCSTFACLDKLQAGKVYWTLTFPRLPKTCQNSSLRLEPKKLPWNLSILVILGG